MARGHIGRRCAACGRKFDPKDADHSCPKSSWGSSYFFIVDGPRDAAGKRQRVYRRFRTRKEAQAALAEVVVKINAGGYTPPSKQTVAEFAHEWLAAIRAGVRASTYASYESNVRAHVVPALGARRIRDLTPPMLNAFYADLLEGTRRRPLSARTTRYVHMILRRMLDDAVKWDQLARNPARLADPPRVRVRLAMNTWSPEELRSFLDHVRGHRLFAAWLLLATTGMRRGEALGLRWSDVDLNAGRLSIERTLVLAGGPVESSPKTERGRRRVEVDPATVRGLRDHRKRQTEERLAWGAAWQDRGFVFTREDGSPIHPEHLSRWFRSHVGRAGLPTIRLHDLRHTWASIALRAGVHPKVVSDQLGHANIAVTLDTYSHVMAGVGADAAHRVAALILGD